MPLSAKDASCMMVSDIYLFLGLFPQILDQILRQDLKFTRPFDALNGVFKKDGEARQVQRK